MGKPSLLIVTNRADPHADEVIRLLNERGTVRPIRINTDDFFSNVQYSFCWDADGKPVESRISIADSGISIDRVDVAWWRKPAPLRPSPKLADPEAIRVAQEEGEAFIRCIGAPFPDLVWVNDPQAMRAASRKLEQISVAREVGLSIPETIVTNQAHGVAKFLDRYKKCIIKPLAAGAFMLNGQSWGMFTSEITKDELEMALDSVEYAPVLVQRQIVKYSELRITIIGDQTFACAIETQGSRFRDVRTDWRVIEPELIPHRIVSIPDHLEMALKGMLKYYGLNFGAFDVIVEPDGRYYFLELNPNGQYLWIELITGAPMSMAVVTLIEKLCQ